MGKFSHEFASWGDATWKERHAKGVPVKMTDSQLRKAKPAVEDRQHVYGKEGEYPGVACWDLN